MILTGSLVAQLIESATIESFFSGVAASYLANHVPLLKPVKGFEESAEKCYEKAVKKWAKNNEMRKALIPKINCFKSLQEYAKEMGDESAVGEIVQIWINVLHEDAVCRQLVVELKLDEVNKKLDNLLKEVKENGKRIQEIHDWINQFTTKGICKFHEQGDYIERYCVEKDADELFFSLSGMDTRQHLSYFVVNSEKGKGVALVSSMQTGKSTELYNLAWEAQQSGHWQPLLFRLSDLPSLTYNDLPEKEKVADLPILLLIDALDEANEQLFCCLVKEIRYYVEQHPAAHVVVSCRSNFADFLDEHVFTKVKLQPLSWAEAMAYIKKKMPTKGHQLIKAIANNDLFDLATIPLTLNVMIRQYADTGILSTGRAALYDLIVRESIKIEHGKQLTMQPISEGDELKLLECVAGTMIVMGKRELTEEEFNKVLGGKTKLDQLRFDILQKAISDSRTLIKFKSNAILEYMAARLLTRCKGIEELRCLTCDEGGGKINQWWEQPLRLWTEIVENDAPNMKTEAVDWLVKEAPSIAVFAPRTLIDDNERGKIIINLLKTYQKENRPLYVFGNDLSQKRLRIPRDVILYLTNEWKIVTTVSYHLKNLQMITRLLDWEGLLSSYPHEMNDLKDALYDCLEEPLFSGEHSEYIYLAMANDHFFTGNETKRLFEHIKNRTNKHDVEVMVSRISILGNVNPYADYLIDAETLLRRDRSSNDYQIVVREPLYTAIGKLTEETALEKALNLMSGGEYWRYADKKEHADASFGKIIEKTRKLIDDGNSTASLIDAMAKACEQQERWIMKPLPEPTSEQVARTTKTIAGEVETLCNFIKFRGQARSVLTNYSNSNGRVDWRKVYEDEITSDEKTSQYVMEFMIMHGADEKTSDINEKKAREALNDEQKYKIFRMKALYDFIRGRRMGYELTPKQEHMCLETAENILEKMVEKPHAGTFTDSEQIALELLLAGKINVTASTDNYKALLYFIHVPLNTSIDNLFDDDPPSLLRYIEGKMAPQDFEELVFEMIESPTKAMDNSTYDALQKHLVRNHHQKTLTMLAEVVKKGWHSMTAQWIFDLVEEGSMTDSLIAAADEIIGKLRRYEKVTEGKVSFVFELCDALMSKPNQHKWVKETLVAVYARYDLVQMRKRISMLFRLGSDEALRLVLSNPLMLKDTMNYEFCYDQESSVMLLARMYCLCRSKRLFAPVMNTILESLSKIAMKNKVTLEHVKNVAVKEIKDFGIERSMSVVRWAERLDEMYLMEHQPKRNVEAALQFIYGQVA